MAFKLNSHLNGKIGDIMPYIKSKNDRRIINGIIRFNINYLKPKGMLNYFLFALAKRTCHSYNDYKEFIGELECAKAEIIRRQLAPYEDFKIKLNGDVDIDDI